MIRIAYRFAVLAAGTAALVAMTDPACAGYWKFRSYAFNPTQEQLSQAKAAPGHVLEKRASGAFQAKYSGKGTIDLFFKTDDADLKVFITQMHCNFGFDAPGGALVPGQTLKFSGDAAITANAGSASGTCKAAIDNGDYIFVADVKPGANASGQGTARVPGGGPGATMRIYGAAYMANVGALGVELNATYDWVDGPAPQ